MEVPVYFWVGFFFFIIIALGIDLGIYNRKPKALSFKEAYTMTGIWVLIASLFCTLIYIYSGRQPALEFMTGYVIELSLSMDNVFVFVLIFSYFKVPLMYQHRVLFWGIVGAIVLRFIMITGGIYLFEAFDWIFYIFGAVLIYSGIKIITMKDQHNNVAGSTTFITKFLSKYFNVTDKYYNDKFFATDENGKRVITPLFIVLLFVEQTDLIFALDSIPAIIAVTQNPFIVFTSNIFAILGLRSLYFMVANIIERFAYFKFGISIILVFVGIKMIISKLGYHIAVEYSLLFIVITLFTSIVVSLVLTKKQ